MKIRTIIGDDEPLGRERIRALLKNDIEVELIEECPDGRRAVAAIERLRPDLVFLDVQMPGMDGFAVLDAIAGDCMPVCGQSIGVFKFSESAERMRWASENSAESAE